MRQFDQANNSNEFLFYATGNSSSLYVLRGSTLPLTGILKTPPLVGFPNRSVAFADRSVLQPETVYLTTDSGRPSQVWLSEDGGDMWENVTGNLDILLPAASYRELVANPSNLDQLYLATNVGVLRSDDGGDSWYSYMNGLPMVLDVRSIELSFDNAKQPEVMIGTYGRGWWRRVVDDSPLEAPIFLDGFESGDISAWSGSIP